MALSRLIAAATLSFAAFASTTALGVAVALGEIEMPKAEEICRNLDLYSSVASCSSGGYTWGWRRTSLSVS